MIVIPCIKILATVYMVLYLSTTFVFAKYYLIPRVLGSKMFSRETNCVIDFKSNQYLAGYGEALDPSCLKSEESRSIVLTAVLPLLKVTVGCTVHTTPPFNVCP